MPLTSVDTNAPMGSLTSAELRQMVVEWAVGTCCVGDRWLPSNEWKPSYFLENWLLFGVASRWLRWVSGQANSHHVTSLEAAADRAPRR